MASTVTELMMRRMMGARGSSVDWESIARGMIDFSTPFAIDLALATDILDQNNVLSAETFYNRSNMTKFEIPTHIITIAPYALRGCAGLTNIVVPSSVNQIQANAFNGCAGLQYVIIDKTTPPLLVNSNAFGSTNDCPIYVPDASVNDYKTESQWSNLASRIFPISDLTT